MDEISTQNRSTNASDVGLIVQGSLILLSAIVALLGYSLQSRLKKKERKRELDEQHEDYLRKAQLVLLRAKLRTFVGPATQLAMSAWNTIWRNCFDINSFKSMGAYEKHGAGAPLVNLNLLAGGDRIHKHWVNPVEEGGMNFSFFPGMMRGEWNGITSFVGIEIENEIRNEPTSKLARHYFQFCKRVVKRYAAPLRDLFLSHSQTLDVRHSTDEFKKAYPVFASAGWLRNLMYLDLIEWVNCFEEIFEQWNSNMYDNLFPQEVNFPLQTIPFLTKQLSELREKETALGSANHKVLANNIEEDRIRSLEKQGSKKSVPVKEVKEVESSKYVHVGKKE